MSERGDDDDDDDVDDVSNLFQSESDKPLSMSTSVFRLANKKLCLSKVQGE